MTPNELLLQLTALPADHTLIVETPDGPIGAGYHITELKYAQMTGIDCGARFSRWDEATLQLLDGHGGNALTVGKAAAILRQSIASVPGLGDSPLHVECAPGNRGLRRYRPGDLRSDEDAAILPLAEQTAQCKPAAIWANTTLGCCASAVAERCCA
ncbi:DUF6428 family protein [Roseobacter sinensis]|uniref:DUF6428 family protein n=1 Tax=Roseobacter sinensis TaxID=2931391 RepID=A0ABT3BKL1_9RHOB|nr:DUF6428 family protein [Roseobacter sp. WL0113]MCV3274108.1 DUF6428 family protein [Roseobacter sp. WL0113]